MLTLVWTAVQPAVYFLYSVPDFPSYLFILLISSSVIYLLRDPRIVNFVGTCYVLFLMSVTIGMGFIDRPFFALVRMVGIFLVSGLMGRRGVMLAGLFGLGFIVAAVRRIELDVPISGEPTTFWLDYAFLLLWHWMWGCTMTNLHLATSLKAQQELEQKNLWLFVQS
jgi:hypothetical protein